MTATVHFFPQINDVPVTHISDIEPLVYESSETIKFLVARPAQEVCTSSKHCFNYYRYCDTCKNRSSITI